MDHIYLCEIKNSEIDQVPYSKIFGNYVEQMKKISEKFRKYFDEKEQEKIYISKSRSPVQ